MTPQRTVLLVEDDNSDALLIRRALEKTGQNFILTRAKHGEEAIDYLSGTGAFEDRSSYPVPDVVLLDIKLPRRSGLEVLEWLRAQPAAVGRIPVVMLTSSRHAVDVNRAYELCVNGYLTKPDTAQELQAMLLGFKEYWLRWNEAPQPKSSSRLP
jgi:CheY-like chemotaxis protein